jgi:hypothetical protein
MLYDTSTQLFNVGAVHLSTIVEVEGVLVIGVETVGASAANAVLKDAVAAETGLLTAESEQMDCTVNVYAVLETKPVAMHACTVVPLHPVQLTLF